MKMHRNTAEIRADKSELERAARLNVHRACYIQTEEVKQLRFYYHIQSSRFISTERGGSYHRKSSEEDRKG